MAVDSVQDLIVTELDGQLADTAGVGDPVNVRTDFAGKTVPGEGWLLAGNAEDLQPGSDGSPPTGEVIKYDNWVDDGDGTSHFVIEERGVGNTTAQTWDDWTVIGLASTAELFNLLFGCIQPNDDGTYTITNVSVLEADSLILAGEYGAEWNQSEQVNSELERLGSAQGMTAGSAFDSIYPWGGMQRVNLADDGTVNDVYGDTDYVEDGSNGQVMVRIPKFWYRIEQTADGFKYWVSPLPKPNYKIHPAFLRGGEIRDYIYVGAFEGTLYDDSAGAYAGGQDLSSYDYSNDMLASVAGYQPISGESDHLDILEARQLGHNRGTGWWQQDYLARTAYQLLAYIEYADFNMQSKISEGITNLDSGSGNHSQNTGHTSSLGNSSGEVVIDTLENGATGADETYACSYRGIENPWGNLWIFADGVFVKDDGFYYQSDPAEWGTDESGYIHVPATPLGTDEYVSGYVDDIFYDTELDWWFYGASVDGSSSEELTDYLWSHQPGETNILRSGGHWTTGSQAGLSYLASLNDVGSSNRTRGARLEFIG